VTELPPYGTAIDPAWIDYNGHLRDAYYGLILSYAADAMMDHIGIDSAYRERTRCTLYTLETHLIYLHEIKSTDVLSVSTAVLAADRKRIHVGCTFRCARLTEPAAVAEALLLHVQQGEKVRSAAFPTDIEQTLEGLTLDPTRLAAFGPCSRRIELKRR
jgi:acyl-CoA thioester hydrolase